MIKREYRAICFDLDGTLLPMDIDEFMGAYFKRIAAWAGSHGLDPELFMIALKAGTRAMAMNDADALNVDIFWDEFFRIYGDDNLHTAGAPSPAIAPGLPGVPTAADAPGMTHADVRAMADDFYERDFGHIGDGFRANPAAARAVETLRAKGYPLVLTTMPMFPLRAVRHRLGWAGVNPDAFVRITSYENSKSTKPRQTYYAENLAAMGLRGSDVLMVGNNTMEDMTFMDLGADGWLVTDWLLDPVDFDLRSIKHGTFAEFTDWCESLPPCANPATNITAAPIPFVDTQRAYADNLIREIDPETTKANAKVLANAIASDHVPGSSANVRMQRS